MKNILLFLCLIMVSCNNNDANETGDKDSSAIHYNGVYSSDIRVNENTGDKSISYLRFYDDGTVINVSTMGTPKEISKWFVKGHENVSKGTYTIEQDNISFTAGGNNVDVEYKGKITNKQTLQLHTKSLSNNNEADITYSFVKDE